MNILFVSQALAKASYRGKLNHLAQKAAVTVAVPGRYEPSQQAAYRLIPAPWISLGHMQLRGCPRLPSIVSAAAPDLIHIEEEPFSLSGWQAARIAAARHIPYVFVTWQNIHKRYLWPIRKMEKFVHSHAQGAIAGNEEAGKILKAKGFSKPLLVGPSFGVDTELFKPSRNHSAKRKQLNMEDSFVIGFAGRLVPEKGLGLLLETFRRLPENAALLIVGDGPWTCVLHQALSSDAALGKRVFHQPAVPTREVPDWLQAMDVLILPSQTRRNWKEQFGYVLIEAMACGVPVIGSTSGEIPHVIGEAGLLFQESSAGELQEKILFLMTRPEERLMLIQRGMQRALEHFTNEKIAQGHLDFYRSVLRWKKWD